jgi:hypothetical protein
LAAYGLQANSPERGGPIILTLGGPRRNASPVSLQRLDRIVTVPQRSPVILVLLVAATLALDAVAISWLRRDGVLSEAPYFYDALVSAQLALVCLWAVFSSRYATLGWIATVTAVLVVSKVTSHISNGSTFAEEVGSNGSYVGALAVALWILKRTEFWRRLTGSGPIVWQYSVTQLLSAMTIVAVIIVSLRHSELLTDWWQPLVTLTVGDVVVALATTLLWAGKELVVIRLASACATAIIVGLCEAPSQMDLQALQPAGASHFRLWLEMVVYAVIISLVIFTWLELVPIVPTSRRAKSAATEAQN